VVRKAALRSDVLKRLLLVALLLAACKREPAVPPGDPARGKAAIDKYGCTTCHVIPGIPGPRGAAGPSLDHIASRPLLAGKFRNDPATMTRWLQNPQAMDPANSMPALGITPQDARDIAAYLYTLK
jgi:cytochrome c